MLVLGLNLLGDELGLALGEALGDKLRLALIRTIELGLRRESEPSIPGACRIKSFSRRDSISDGMEPIKLSL